MPSLIPCKSRFDFGIKIKRGLSVYPPRLIAPFDIPPSLSQLEITRGTNPNLKRDIDAVAIITALPLNPIGTGVPSTYTRGRYSMRAVDNSCSTREKKRLGSCRPRGWRDGEMGMDEVWSEEEKEGGEKGERALDPLGRQGVTKRFANPSRSRATRGRENAW